MANQKEFTYQTILGRLKFLVLIQGLLALMGLVPFIPGQVRHMFIITAGVLCLFSILVILN